MTYNKDCRVLVSDSDLNFLSIAYNKLSSRGFKVSTSSSSEETIRILKEFGCDSLLININKDDERKALIEYVETMKVKPTILYSNNSIDEYSPVELFY